ncbi:MAG: hypothetical protein A4E58_02383 [Syntrophorhabdus sp. PtaB.Bin006]|nr:MAG: hypothetical protein A4E58_02383 [Syntrophorhabdus sp. PtaB.Bin006]
MLVEFISYNATIIVFCNEIIAFSDFSLLPDGMIFNLLSRIIQPHKTPGFCLEKDGIKN